MKLDTLSKALLFSCVSNLRILSWGTVPMIACFFSFFNWLDADRDQCINYQKRSIEGKKDQSLANYDVTDLTDVPLPLPNSSVDDGQARTVSKNNATSSQARKTPKTIPTVKRPSQTSSEFSIRNENQGRRGDHRPTASSIAINSSSIEQSVRDNDSYQTGFDDAADLSIGFNDDVNHDIYLEKINALSLKVNQLQLLIKERDLEIKRLRSTTIGKQCCQ